MVMIGSFYVRLPFSYKKSQKGTENYDESNGKKTGSTKKQEKTLKRMMAYQKKAEQMVSRKRMNHHMIRKG